MIPRKHGCLSLVRHQFSLKPSIIFCTWSRANPQLAKHLSDESRSQEAAKETSLIKKIYRGSPDHFNPHKLAPLTGTLSASESQMWTYLPVCQHVFQWVAVSHRVTHTQFILTPSLRACGPRGGEKRWTILCEVEMEHILVRQARGLFACMWCAIMAATRMIRCEGNSVNAS